MRTKEEVEAYLQKLNAEYDEIFEQLQRLKIRELFDYEQMQGLFNKTRDIAIVRGTLKWVLGEVVK